MFRKLFSTVVPRFLPRAKPKPAMKCYSALVGQARQADLFHVFGLHDTRDTRLELVFLHLFMVLEAIKPKDSGFNQSLFDCAFIDLDNNLREMGVGDLSVGKKVQGLASVFYGRALQYNLMLKDDDAGILAETFGSTAPGFLPYIRQSMAQLAAQDITALKAGQLNFAAIVDDAAQADAGNNQPQVAVSAAPAN